MPAITVGQKHRVDMHRAGSSSLKPHLQLWVNGTATKDSTDTATQAILEFTPEAGKNYVLRAGSQGFTTTGAYHIQLTKGTSSGTCKPQARPKTVKLNQTVRGELCTNGQVDVYLFTYSKVQNVRFEAEATSGGLKPNLELYRASDAQLLVKTSSEGTKVWVEFKPARKGVKVILRVGSWQRASEGGYTLKILPQAS